MGPDGHCTKARPSLQSVTSDGRAFHCGPELSCRQHLSVNFSIESWISMVRAVSAGSRADRGRRRSTGSFSEARFHVLLTANKDDIYQLKLFDHGYELAAQPAVFDPKARQ